MKGGAATESSEARLKGSEKLKIRSFNHLKGFPDSSVGKESACNSGDPSSIPGSGRSAGEGISYPL